MTSSKAANGSYSWASDMAMALLPPHRGALCDVGVRLRVAAAGRISAGAGAPRRPDGVGSGLHEDPPYPRRPFCRAARLRLRAALRRGRRPRRRHLTGALPARGGPDGAGSAPAARRALLVLPV